MSRPIFAFDEEDEWQKVGAPTNRFATASDEEEWQKVGAPTNRFAMASSDSPQAPSPTPDQSPRNVDERRARSSSASRYFGREQRVSGESGSVTWVRVES